MSTKARATAHDLSQVPENRKAEIVNGEIVLMSPTGAKPGRAPASTSRSACGDTRGPEGRASHSETTLASW
jgi:hypothetical protein